MPFTLYEETISSGELEYVKIIRTLRSMMKKNYCKTFNIFTSRLDAEVHTHIQNITMCTSYEKE